MTRQFPAKLHRIVALLAAVAVMVALHVEANRRAHVWQQRRSRRTRQLVHILLEGIRNE